ncbi:ABC transporter substrate-binding protein [Marinitenerispora sediminis]|uniref:ABC transporter substrate-binding protein n=1 Tax=Marinitenerispora sediminis TaxID=1931232 RepID=A0A368T3R1_9ACTN|nr:ABC transporter substrate-binding protein [Marinitenerispora sediminis]RCV49452.1 ABC transporter substrate-binding protein [Marinitenerispora sediminis]RCV50518.1 ABC transporter substrate-binding protein [Marinitenerispora sediminis]RCV56810.1 ABC transporter substrate-binding protein [Marinitenerispora sediminis]
MRVPRRLLAVPLLTVLAVSGCASGAPEETEAAAPSAGFPVTVTDARGEVTLDEAPQRIVSLSPSGTEILFAVGAGDQVVAADEYSDYPAEAPTTDLSGFTPSVEAISDHDPDLVVLARDAEDTATQLDELHIPVLLLPAAEDLDDTYDQMRLLGSATGHADEGAAAAEEVQGAIDEIVSDTRDQLGEADTSYYHELDAGLYSVTSDTFVGQVYSLFGLRNIADEAADTAGGYPQLSAEFVVEQDPDLIFLSYPGGDAAVADLADRPAFDTIAAVENGDVVALDPDTASRWGPRVVDFTQDVADALLAAEGRGDEDAA